MAKTLTAQPRTGHKFLTVDEAADILRTSRKSITAMIRRGGLPGTVQIGDGTRHSTYRIPTSAHVAFESWAAQG